MKYIIELDENAKEVVVISLEDGDMWTNTMEADDLEQLNSEYIRDNFGQLLETAYQKGFEDGKKTPSELASNAEYQRGLDDAWEMAKRIVLTKTDANCPYFSLEELNSIFGASSLQRVIDTYSVSEAIEKVKAYEEQQKAADDIKVGDEVEHTVSGYTSKAIFLEKNEYDVDRYKCLFWTGCGVTILSYPKRQFKRTGRHFDIDKILEEMRE